MQIYRVYQARINISLQGGINNACRHRRKAIIGTEVNVPESFDTTKIEMSKEIIMSCLDYRLTYAATRRLPHSRSEPYCVEVFASQELRPVALS